jgi:hypothetical protein
MGCVYPVQCTRVTNTFEQTIKYLVSVIAGNVDSSPISEVSNICIPSVPPLLPCDIRDIFFEGYLGALREHVLDYRGAESWRGRSQNSESLYHIRMAGTISSTKCMILSKIKATPTEDNHLELFSWPYLWS